MDAVGRHRETGGWKKTTFKLNFELVWLILVVKASVRSKKVGG